MQDQDSMEREYERQHSTEQAAKVKREMQQKFDLVIHGKVKSVSEIGIMYDAKTGEKLYYRKGKM